MLVCGFGALYAAGQAGDWVATMVTGVEHTRDFYLVRILILFICCAGPIGLVSLVLLLITRRRS